MHNTLFKQISQPFYGLSFKFVLSFKIFLSTMVLSYGCSLHAEIRLKKDWLCATEFSKPGSPPINYRKLFEFYPSNLERTDGFDTREIDMIRIREELLSQKLWYFPGAFIQGDDAKKRWNQSLAFHMSQLSPDLQILFNDIATLQEPHSKLAAKAFARMIDADISLSHSTIEAIAHFNFEAGGSKGFNAIDELALLFFEMYNLIPGDDLQKEQYHTQIEQNHLLALNATLARRLVLNQKLTFSSSGLKDFPKSSPNKLLITGKDGIFSTSIVRQANVVNPSGKVDSLELDVSANAMVIHDENNPWPGGVETPRLGEGLLGLDGKIHYLWHPKLDINRNRNTRRWIVLVKWPLKTVTIEDGLMLMGHKFESDPNKLAAWYDSFERGQNAINGRYDLSSNEADPLSLLPPEVQKKFGFTVEFK